MLSITTPSSVLEALLPLDYPPQVGYPENLGILIKKYMNQKYYVFNHSGSISQFFTSESDAIDFVESFILDNVLYHVPDDLQDLCIVEIKYYVEKNKLVKV